MSRREMITLCGDDCAQCPRYNARSEEELARVAELWYRVGWRDTILSAEEMRCDGCHEGKKCTYGLVDCTREHGVDRCGKCAEFPCEKISGMLERSREYQNRCLKVCSEEEYMALERSFFRKEENLRKC